MIDALTITTTGGRGGNGAISFRREKYVPRGGPDGGNGGKGGDVVIKGDSGKQTLLDLRYKKKYNAGNGKNGGGRDRTGQTGSDIIIYVPFGTMVFDEENGMLLADISRSQPEFLLAKGGRGGRGNSSFTNSTQRAPRTAETGEDGEGRIIRLELKLIADVGIIGYPNAGKSTFISTVSAAKSKIADYPFTTLTPVLGVVKDDTGSSFVIADMPGLIEGASKGDGLGRNFLRHIERTDLLLHFVDVSAYPIPECCAEEPVVDRYLAIRKELESYSCDVAVKREAIVATKTDSTVKENLERLAEYALKNGKPFFKISSLSKEGIPELLLWIHQILQDKSAAEECTKNSL
ncbi:MAG: GTPase ObgE [Deferribacteraceae bacterium]|jgi:GTP-binding protein|nr:GTPase ObgE [Deferribacteraceae bacterium]